MTRVPPAIQPTFTTYFANASVIARTLRGGWTRATIAEARAAVDRQPTKAELRRAIDRLERTVIDTTPRDDGFRIPQWTGAAT